MNAPVCDKPDDRGTNQAAKQGICHSDTHGILRYVNADAEKMLGYAPGELLGRPFHALLAPEDVARAKQRFELRKAGIAGATRYHLQKKDGAAICCDVLSTPSFDVDGQCLGVTAFLIDVDRQRRHNELATEERRLLRDIAGERALPDVLSDLCTVLERYSSRPLRALVLANRDGTLACIAAPRLATEFCSDPRVLRLDTNDSACARAMQTRRPVIVADTAQSAASPALAALRHDHGIAAVWSYPVVQADRVLGVLALLPSEASAPDADDEYVIAFALELARIALTHAGQLADLRTSERRLRDLALSLDARVHARTAALKEVNRELDAFNFSVTHDLRTPLRAIEGFSRALLETHAEQLDEEGRDYLRRIGAAATRMGDLIEAMYDLSRLSRTPLRIDRIDLSRIVHEVIADLQARDPQRRVDVRVADTPFAEGDPRLLRIALTNLLDNAWKYTAHASNARIVFDASLDGDGRSIYRISDNGDGFDMRFADKLFTLFHRLHPDEVFPGQGIGLATAQRIIRRHGGEIRAQARKGEGASFSFGLWEERGTRNELLRDQTDPPIGTGSNGGLPADELES